MNTPIDYNFVNKKIYEDDLIVLSNVIKKYKKNVVLDVDYLKIKKNYTYLFIGENGSGKSTLIKCICNLINYEGLIISKAKVISYLPERFSELANLNCIKFLSMMKIYKGDNNIIKEMCDFFDFPYEKNISALSKGSIQKMMIILTLINKADLYIFDEPLNGLDKMSQEKFFYLIRHLRSSDKTIIITTHYKDKYTGLYDYVVSLDKGKIL